jgi:hypothetical protein
MMQFSHPLNQHTVRVRAPRLWTLLFGPLYLAYQGAWSQALISTLVALVSGGVSWLVYPFFAPRIVRTAYLHQGWREAA